MVNLQGYCSATGLISHGQSSQCMGHLEPGLGSSTVGHQAWAGWLSETSPWGPMAEAAVLMWWVSALVCPLKNKHFTAVFMHAASAEPIFAARQACNAAAEMPPQGAQIHIAWATQNEEERQT